MNKIKTHFLKNSTSNEMLEMVECIKRAEDYGLLVEVIYTALKEMKEFPNSSPLLCMQVALEDWDV